MTRLPLLVAAAALPLATLAACAADQSPGDPEAEPTPDPTTEEHETTGDEPTDDAPSADDLEHSSLTIGLTYVEDIQFAPFYVALERGYYEEAGLDVTLEHHGWDGGLFTSLIAGQEDLVYAGGAEAAEQRLNSAEPLVSVATFYQEHPVGLIALAESGIASAEDLQGATIGVPGRYGETWFGLLAILDDAGLSEDDVTIEEIGFTQQADLMAGNVDAAMGYLNNDAVRLEDNGYEIATISVPAESLVGVGLITLEETLTEQGDAVAAAVEATLRGVRDVIEDPEAAVEISAGYVPDLDREDGRTAALSALEATVPLFGEVDPAADPGDLGALGRQDPHAWQATLDLLAEHGIASGDLPAEQLWTDSALP